MTHASRDRIWMIGGAGASYLEQAAATNREWAAALVNACGAMADARTRRRVTVREGAQERTIRRFLRHEAAILGRGSWVRARRLAWESRRYFAATDADSRYWEEVVDTYAKAAEILFLLTPPVTTADARRRSALLHYARLLELKAEQCIPQLSSDSVERARDAFAQYTEHAI
jgi:hypothetical protein